MRIVVYVLAVLLLLLTAYIVDLVLTTGKFISNVLMMAGIQPQELATVDAYAIQAIAIGGTVTLIALVLHVARSIRRGEG